MLSLKEIQHEKKVVALSSVGAAIGLTTVKIVVALLTGSLGILAEAAHSGLDLVASLMTYFAVRVADRPPDETHHYGHGKVENLSAFLESGLLIATAVWVSYEAARRLIFHQGHVDASAWAFLVMALAIVVDFTRSRALMRVAHRLGSQALEADELHFSTDIWSSGVVIAGLLVVRLSQSFPLPAWLGQADAVAALGVSAIVIWVGLRLLRVTVDALLDRAPDTLRQLESAIAQVPGVTEIRWIRERSAGYKLFADVVIAAPRTYTFEQIHTLSDQVEQAAIASAHSISPQSDVDVLVHVEPTASPGETLIDQIHYLAERQGVHAHDIHAREVNGRLEADFDIEVHADVNLQEAHAIASRLEQAIRENNPLVDRVTTHLEAPAETVVRRRDVTERYADMAGRIVELADAVAGKGSAHDVHLYQSTTTQLDYTCSTNQQHDLVLHTFFDPHNPLSQAHIQAEEIKRALRQEYPNLGSIAIHTEPPE